MMRTLKRRILVMLTATIIAAVCGLLAACLVGRFITLKMTERKLFQDASQASAEADIRLTEARAVLAAMKDSSSPPCSTAELTYFRALIFEAKYLKDAGRMSDGKIDCSALLARPMQPLALVGQDVTIRGGAKVYKDIALYRSEGLAVVTYQDGDFYIVLIPRIQPHLGPGPEHYSEMETDARSGQISWLLGEPPPVKAATLARDGLSRAGNSLYATRCSRMFSNCVTAYISIPEALSADHTQFRIYIALGGLTGAVIGFMLSLFYRRSRSMEQQLRRAIRKDQLRIVYQPIVDLANGRIVGAEALARWTDEEGYAVGPDVFVKIAEERGFVGLITRLVVRHVLCDFAATLRAHPDFHISINVSAADLGDPGFLLMLNHALEQAGVAAQSVVIEITEGSTVQYKTAMETIVRLHQRGHSVHIDDFGTGYSSLSYLHDLSVDVIKIDKSFTQTVGTEAVTAGIVPQILAMAEALGLRVIVEGIETTQQAEYFAAQTQSILGQGWLFSHAVAPEEFHRLLAEDEKRAQAAKAV
jgi:sensor c-di-GMP phosphodiesterase-like protein